MGYDSKKSSTPIEWSEKVAYAIQYKLSFCDTFLFNAQGLGKFFLESKFSFYRHQSCVCVCFDIRNMTKPLHYRIQQPTPKSSEIADGRLIVQMRNAFQTNYHLNHFWTYLNHLKTNLIVLIVHGYNHPFKSGHTMLCMLWIYISAFYKSPSSAKIRKTRVRTFIPIQLWSAIILQSFYFLRIINLLLFFFFVFVLFKKITLCYW